MRKPTLLLLLTFVACASIALANTGCTSTNPCKLVDPMDIVEWNSSFYERVYWTIEKLPWYQVNPDGQLKGINMLELHGLGQWPLIIQYFCEVRAVGASDAFFELDNGYTHINNYAQKSNEDWEDLKNRTDVTQADLYEVLAFMVETIRRAYDVSNLQNFEDRGKNMMDCFCNGTHTNASDLSGEGGIKSRFGGNSVWFDASQTGHLNRFLGNIPNGTNYAGPDDLGSSTVDNPKIRWDFLQTFRVCMYRFKDLLSDYNDQAANGLNFTNIAEALESLPPP